MMMNARALLKPCWCLHLPVDIEVSFPGEEDVDMDEECDCIEEEQDEAQEPEQAPEEAPEEVKSVEDAAVNAAEVKAGLVGVCWFLHGLIPSPLILYT